MRARTTVTKLWLPKQVSQLDIVLRAPSYCSLSEIRFCFREETQTL